MGLRFRKSIKIAPGVRLSATTRGLGLRVGPRGAGLSITPSGTRVSAGIPGTGLYWSERVGGARRRSASRPGGGSRSTTAGEKLTHKAAGERYVGISLGMDSLFAARELYRALRHYGARSLNVAGNGIYTLNQHGWSQAQLNAWVPAVLAKVHEFWPLVSVRSGGQTGVDMSGVIAAHALGIDALLLFPKGYRQRGTDKVDRRNTPVDIQAQIEEGCQALASVTDGKKGDLQRRGPVA